MLPAENQDYSYSDKYISFMLPSELQLHVRHHGNVALYKANHAKVKMEINMFIGSVSDVLKEVNLSGIETKLQENNAILAKSNQNIIGRLFLNYFENDLTTNNALLTDNKGSVITVKDLVKLTKQDYQCFECVVKINTGKNYLIRYTGLVFDTNSNKILIIGYRSNYKNYKSVDRWKEKILQSFMFQSQS